MTTKNLFRVKFFVLVAIAVLASGEMSGTAELMFDKTYKEAALHGLVALLFPICLWVAGKEALAMILTFSLGFWAAFSASLINAHKGVIAAGTALGIRQDFETANNILEISLYRGWGDHLYWYVFVTVAILIFSIREVKAGRKFA